MKTFIVDAFTNQPFRGNPAGVCILDNSLADDVMLCIAQELNLSETAFISPARDERQFDIRYFSPMMEIPLCGHATMAAAQVVFASFGYRDAIFVTATGVDLPVEMSNDGISMVFPVYETYPADAPPALLAALGIESVTNVVFNKETRILLLEISDTQTLANLEPNFLALYASHDAINGVDHRSVEDRQIRLSFAIFLAMEWHQRRSGNRRNAHISDQILGAKTWQNEDAFLSVVKTAWIYGSRIESKSVGN